MLLPTMYRSSILTAYNHKFADHIYDVNAVSLHKVVDVREGPMTTAFVFPFKRVTVQSISVLYELQGR